MKRSKREQVSQKFADEGLIGGPKGTESVNFDLAISSEKFIEIILNGIFQT